jgi:hypothetical protein
VLTLVLAVLLAGGVEVERVLALVGGTPILASDLELAEAARLVPRAAGEDDAAHRSAAIDALVALELRWQDLETAAMVSRVQVDLDAAWAATITRAGGEDSLQARLAAIGLPEAALRELVRRAAIVQAYVGVRFAPFVRPSPEEVEQTFRDELAPALRAKGQPVPELAAVRAEVEALVRERKLTAEVERWTADLARRIEVVRYVR